PRIRLARSTAFAVQALDVFNYPFEFPLTLRQTSVTTLVFHNVDIAVIQLCVGQAALFPYVVEALAECTLLFERIIKNYVAQIISRRLFLSKFYAMIVRPLRTLKQGSGVLFGL